MFLNLPRLECQDLNSEILQVNLKLDSIVVGQSTTRPTRVLFEEKGGRYGRGLGAFLSELDNMSSSITEPRTALKAFLTRNDVLILLPTSFCKSNDRDRQNMHPITVECSLLIPPNHYQMVERLCFTILK